MMPPSKYLLIMAKRAADEVAVAVGEVGVVAGDEGVEAEAAVLAEGDFAEQEIAEDIGGEEVCWASGALSASLGVNLLRQYDVAISPKASRMVSVRTMLPRDLDIFDSSKSSQPLATTALGSGRPAAIRNAGQ